jgi:hypothetical protein
VAKGEAQEGSRPRRRQPMFPYRRQDDHSPLLCLRQGNRLPDHAPRVTDLLFTYGVTLSLFLHKSSA